MSHSRGIRTCGSIPHVHKTDRTLTPTLFKEAANSLGCVVKMKSRAGGMTTKYFNVIFT